LTSRKSFATGIGVPATAGRLHDTRSDTPAGCRTGIATLGYAASASCGSALKGWPCLTSLSQARLAIREQPSPSKPVIPREGNDSRGAAGLQVYITKSRHDGGAAHDREGRGRSRSRSAFSSGRA
jgi:hypothetical protein